MKEPAFYQQAFMQSIETVVLIVREEFTQLKDDDVAFALDRLTTYFQLVAKGKAPEEPLSTIDRRQELIDEILNIIDEREEIEADLPFINNPDIRPNGNPIPSLPSFYATCLKILLKSVKFWRKNNGKTGYLNYISSLL